MKNRFGGCTELRINVGCGPAAAPGWINFDNSYSVALAHRPLVVSALTKAKLLSTAQRHLIEYAARHDIIRADAGALPIDEGSAVAVYSSHMMEHLHPGRARGFLAEVVRILAPRGRLRLVLPDLRILVDDYISTRDADEFVGRTLLSTPSPQSTVHRIARAVVGDRHHLWMYDAASAMRLLSEVGFSQIVELPPGETTLEDPSGLDLYERSNESFYIEAAVLDD